MSDDGVDFIDAPEYEKYFEEMDVTNMAKAALQVADSTTAIATIAKGQETVVPADNTAIATIAKDQDTVVPADNADLAITVDADDGEKTATFADDADAATVADDNDSAAEEDDSKKGDDDDRPLDINGNPMEEEDNQTSHEATMEKVAQDQAIALKANGKMQTKRGSRGIVDLAALQRKAGDWVETLFLNKDTRRVVLIIINNFTYWDEQFSSHTMVRKLRKEVEKVGTVDALFSGARIDDDGGVLDSHYLKCRIIAITAMVDPKGISIPSVFYGYRTGNSELSKKWVDVLTQVQTLLHWTNNQRVRPPYIKDIAIPYKKPPPKPAKPVLKKPEPKNPTFQRFLKKVRFDVHSTRKRARDDSDDDVHAE